MFSNSKRVLLPMLVMDESIPHWSDFVGDDVEWDWCCDAVSVKVDEKEKALFRIQVVFTRPRRKEFSFYFDPTSEYHRCWLKQLVLTEKFVLLDPRNTNVLVNPCIPVRGSSVLKLLNGIDVRGQLRTLQTFDDEQEE